MLEIKSIREPKHCCDYNMRNYYGKDTKPIFSVFSLISSHNSFNEKITWWIVTGLHTKTTA